MMPDLDGAEVCRRVRQEMPLANMYLILLTSLESRGRRSSRASTPARTTTWSSRSTPTSCARASTSACACWRCRSGWPSGSTELQAALANVKQLHGLLPICSYCKRIRGDDQYWQQVESYIAERSDAQFSHGICPPCYEKLEVEIEEQRKLMRSTRKR